MFIAHAPLSYLANDSIQRKKIETLKPYQEIFVTVLSLIFGILPDMDFLLMMMTNRPSYTHHDVFTHTPVYWIGIWLLLKVLYIIFYPHINIKSKQFFTKDLMDILLNAFLIAGISHLLADLLVGNIMLLYPLTDQNFTILKYIFEPSYFSGYFFSVYFAIEIVIIVLALRSLSRKFLKKYKWDNVVSTILISLSTVYLIFAGVINTQVYSNSFLEDSSKPYIDYDTDFDTLRDTKDYDVDNNGIDNFLDADMDMVVSNAKSIINSNKLTATTDSDVFNWVVNRYGGLTSYRVVSQAFYEARSPIEPVLRNFYIKSYGTSSYALSYDSTEIFREYLMSNDLLIDLNFDSNPILPSGKVFFIIGNDDEILNMGITLDSNTVAIVLPGESRVINHTYDGMLLFYDSAISNLEIYP